MRRRSLTALLPLVAGLTGCALLRQGGEPVEASLVGLRPVQLGLLEQAFELQLRLINPNAEALVVDGLRCHLAIDGAAFGRGVSDQRFTLPRLGEAVVPVRFYVQTTDLVGRLAGLGRTRQRITYRLTGELLVVGRLGAVPFARDGELDIGTPTA